MPTMLIWCLPAMGSDSSEFEVDVIAGGLLSAADILTARHGVAVTFEGVPLRLPGLERSTTIRDDGRVRTRSVLWDKCGFRFAYPAAATPREAAEAAVAAYNRTGCPGHYAVLEDQGILHFVPYETRLDERTWQPYTPLLDTRIELKVTEGTPNQLLRGIEEQLQVAAGVRLIERAMGIGAAGPAVVRMPRSSGTTRQMLDDLLLQLGQETHYALVYVVVGFEPEPEWEGFTFFYLHTKPGDEAVLNRTPITAPAPD